MSIDELYENIMHLSESDRLELVSRVHDSISGVRFGLDLDDPNLEAELNERASDLTDSIEWSQLRNEC